MWFWTFLFYSAHLWTTAYQYGGSGRTFFAWFTRAILDRRGRSLFSPLEDS
jgi:hypothetical protein